MAARLAPKTTRFATIVEECGKPEPYTLWLPPDKDPKFQSALRDSRIMTVHGKSNVGTADHGEIGYQPGKAVELLIFGKSLKKFVGTRVIGIKYGLLKQDTRKAAAQPKTVKPKKSAKAEPAKTEKATEPKLIQFPTITPPAKPEPETAKPDDSAELKALKAEVRKALDALSKDRPVAAYKILERLV